jgi:RimJ/RimL family protein N-acetyltransferase
MLPAAEADPTRFPLAIVVPGIAGGGGYDVVVGMLTLDWGDRSRRYAAADEIGLHGVLVDRRHRGHGYGVAALRALPALVVAEHPQARAIALTVNVRNATAIAAYRAAGFVDTGELFLGGEAGPQHVFRRGLESFDPRDDAA